MHKLLGGDTYVHHPLHSFICHFFITCGDKAMHSLLRKKRKFFSWILLAFVITKSMVYITSPDDDPDFGNWTIVSVTKDELPAFTSQFVILLKRHPHSKSKLFHAVRLRHCFYF